MTEEEIHALSEAELNKFIQSRLRPLPKEMIENPNKRAILEFYERQMWDRGWLGFELSPLNPFELPVVKGRDGYERDDKGAKFKCEVASNYFGSLLTYGPTEGHALAKAIAIALHRENEKGS
jgi:hypothetical protein